MLCHGSALESSAVLCLVENVRMLERGCDIVVESSKASYVVDVVIQEVETENV